ncbi:MAG: helix-turn-helix domain-containing protein [Myxococcota bacterium]
MSGRDRKGVEQRLIDAVGAQIADHGLGALGVNAVAARAGVDKVLIYRYFGGLDGLVERWAASPGFWPSVDEVLQGVPLDGPPGRAARVFLARYRQALAARPATLALLAWECAGDHPSLRALEAARERWALELRDRVALPPEAWALATLLGAGVQYLALRSPRVTTYSGLSLDEPGWEALLDVVERAIDRASA